MIITVDGKAIELSKEHIAKLSERGIEDVEKLWTNSDQRFRLGVKTVLRTFVFPWIEKQLKVSMRPPKEQDPLLYLISTLTHFVEELSEHATINVTTLNTNGSTYRPTAFGLKIEDSSEGGRQLAFSWSEGKRQDSLFEDTSKPSD